MKRFAPVILAAGMALSAAAQPAPAPVESKPTDVVILKNGTEMEGRIVRDTGRGLILELQNPSGRLEFSYDMIDIINGMSADRARTLRREADRMAPAAETMRGLAIVSGLRWTSRSAAQVREAVAESLGRGLDNESMRLMRILKRFDLIPQGMDSGKLRQALALLWAEEVTAQASMEGGEILLIAEGKDVGQKLQIEQPPDCVLWGVDRDRALLTRALGTTLVAQHYRLAAGEGPAGVLDDPSMARRASLEGNGLLLQAEFLASAQGLNASQFEDLGLRDRVSPRGRAAEIAGLPSFLREARLFPARAGGSLYQKAYAAGGWAIVDRVLAHAPVSTEQILHPEKVLVRREDPVEVALPADLVPDASGAWTVVAEFVPGEWWIGRQLELGLGGGADVARPAPDPALQARAAKAAEGWGGARCRIVTREGQTVTLFASIWDTAADADEFFEGMREVWRNRYTGQEVPRGTRASGGATTGFTSPLGAGQMVLKDRIVCYTEGAKVEQLDALIDRLLGATYREPGAAAGVLTAGDWTNVQADRAAIDAFWAGRTPLPAGCAPKVDAGALVDEASGLRIALPPGWTWEAGDASRGELLVGIDYRRGGRISLKLRAVPFGASARRSGDRPSGPAVVAARRALIDLLGEATALRDEVLPVGEGDSWTAAIGTAPDGERIRWGLASTRRADSKSGDYLWILEATADSASASAVGNEAAGILKQLP